jgi:tetratricopeptide (TPR) repeat protein
MATQADWLTGSELLDGYRVEGRLGEGGMGVVYRVRSALVGHSYAVKRTHLRDATGQRQFLTELMNWFDLPRHPHLVDCQFFRTVEAEIAIFAELVESESVYEAIQARRLVRLDQILDVSIQSAWGLHAAHQSGLIHQDVKPGNMLLTSDGAVKVTDFGLARARAVSQDSGDPPSSALVSHAGMTVVYRSPEQARRERLGRGTDIWSWGVSILHMVLGEITWQDGAFAREVLNERSSMLPQAMAELLHKCFQEDPDERWATAGAAARELARIYAAETGRVYPRREPPISPQGETEGYARELTSGIRWGDPAQRLQQAFRAAGSRVWPRIEQLRVRHAKAKAVADLIGFRDALRFIEESIRPRPPMVDVSAIAILLDMAFAEEWLGDIPGAIAAYDQAIAWCKNLLGKFPVLDQIESFLATMYLNKAKTLNSINDLAAADVLLTEAIRLSEIVAERRPEELDQLAAACNNKGEILCRLGRPEASLHYYDRAIEIRKKLLAANPKSATGGLAQSYLNKAEALKSADTFPAALEAYDAALELIGTAGTYQRSAVLLGKADALRILGQIRRAVECCEEALAIRQRLAAAAGTDSALGAALAETYRFLGMLLGSTTGTRAMAPEWFRKAVTIYEGLVREQGRSDLAFDLFAAYTRLAGSLQMARGGSGERQIYDEAFAFLDRFPDLHKQGSDRIGTVATAYFNRGLAAERDGDFEEAIRFYDRALSVWDLTDPEGKNEIRGDVARTRLYRAELLYRIQPGPEWKEEIRKSLQILRAEADRTGRPEWISILELAEREHWLQGE